ncbi:hypothetical protein H4R18_000031 [Coemansia javaensis]|uniref:Myb-like, SWIRM and MPN domain-containing protein 1 n=1 Tax=Coemansia javaensis TaxID=2761396 RepID=A0A9W8HM93_9FUNG|nr:hypothetical protein H4R18_000031 [Coemansia javaensis]
MDSAAAKISAQEEDDLSSALIAKLLAEDSAGGGQYQGYYDDYGNGAAHAAADDDEYASANERDGDWDPGMKRRRKPKAGARQRRPPSSSGHSSANAADPASSSDSERPEGAKRPRKPRPAAKKDKPPPPPPVAEGQYRAGAYTEDEELKFREGLELHGRSWSRISEHVVTRDAKSIRSHAQKYFIKLFRDKAPLPDKVRESGEGYTLSGRPLDPNSAAARPYLQHVMQLDPPPAKPPRPSAAAPAGPADPADPDGPAPASADAPADPSPCDSGAPPATASPAPAAEPDGAGEQQQQPLASPTRTEYAMSRPQRSQARTTALHYDDPHQMVRCTPFAGRPLSNVAGCQPFRNVVHTNALLAMDLHAHLMLAEVIGLLGGRWDAKERVLVVEKAFPCTALETSDAHTNVEMDPGSELIVRQQIADAGLCVVGWYHSHPTFRPDPSIIDIENQTAYQKLFRDSESAEEPFVGAIVGPYDPGLPGPVSVFNWFWVGKSAVDRGHPKRLVVETVADSALPAADQDALLRLLDEAGSLEHRAPLEEAWRPSSTELRSLKMVVSLTQRMPWLLDGPVASEQLQEPAPEQALPDSVPDSTAAGADDAEAGKPGDAVPDSPSDAEPNSQSNAVPDSQGDAEPGKPAEQRVVSHAHSLAGQKAAQDQFLAAVCRRFSAGIFKTAANGEPADPHALGRVLAAYFTQLQ